MHAVIGEDAEGRRLLHGRDFDRAQRDRQVGRDIGSDAEAMGVVDDGLDPEAVGQFQRGDVAGLGQRAPKRNRAFKLFVVVVGLVRGLTAWGT